METYGRELNIHLTILLIINSQIMFGVESIARDQAIGTLQQKKIQEGFFNQGDIFPDFESDWGDVYWQFDGED